MRTYVRLKIFSETERLMLKIIKKENLIDKYARRDLVDLILSKEFVEENVEYIREPNKEIPLRAFQEGFSYHKYGLCEHSVKLKRTLKFIYPYIDNNVLLNTILCRKLEERLENER